VRPLAGQLLVGDEAPGGNLYALAPSGGSYTQAIAAVGPGYYEEADHLPAIPVDAGIPDSHGVHVTWPGHVQPVR
jgi:hypothetical protein